MRKSLLEAFDEIYILDLHGNSRKKETTLDGSKDENVFDIMQGVSINIFVKKGCIVAGEASCHSRLDRESPLARVFHYELYGKRVEKYHYLKTHSIKDVPWQELNLQAPQYFFVPKDFSVQGEYEKGFRIDELMKNYVSGIQSGRDDLFIDVCKNDLKNRISILYSSKRDLKFDEQYKVKDSSGYNLLNRIAATNFNDKKIRITNYRPFDNRYLYYDENLIKRAFYKVQRNLLEKNVCILCCKQLSTSFYRHVFVSENISDLNSISLQTKEQSYVLPLYIYPTENEASLGEQRKPNLDETIWRKIDECVGNKTTPEQVFDYIYGVLHTPSYRERYKEFLKIDFPRIPYPENADEFNRIAAIGEKLRKLHLMQEIPQPLTVSFNIPGDNIVSEVRFENGKVFINKTQCFENVTELAWNFYIGGYQPAQKWLKDRKNRTLTYDDIEHYRKIIAILLETHNLMQELG